jgi:hypothetical protein
VIGRRRPRACGDADQRQQDPERVRALQHRERGGSTGGFKKTALPSICKLDPLIKSCPGPRTQGTQGDLSRPNQSDPEYLDVFLDRPGTGCSGSSLVARTRQPPALRNGPVSAAAPFRGVLIDSRPASKEGSGIDPTRLPHVPHSFAPSSQTVCYLPWLTVSVALRYVRTFPWAPEAWREVRQYIPWLLAEQARIRKAGWFN